MYSEEFDSLNGKTVDKVLFDGDTLTFVCGDEMVSFDLDADCCSKSYFYEITGVENILGKTIVSMSEIPMDVEDGTEDIGVEYPDSVQAYGYRVSAAPGTVTIQGVELETSNDMLIVFRNNSNGYYGGSLEPTQKHASRGTELTSSWKAVRSSK